MAVAAGIDGATQPLLSDALAQGRDGERETGEQHTA